MLGVLLIIVLISTLFNEQWYTKRGLWPEWCGLLESIATVVKYDSSRIQTEE